jgi:hypothetical protein
MSTPLIAEIVTPRRPSTGKPRPRSSAKCARVPLYISSHSRVIWRASSPRRSGRSSSCTEAATTALMPALPTAAFASP